MQRSLKPCICGRIKNVPAIRDENGFAYFTQGGEKDRTTHPRAHKFIIIIRRHHHRDIKLSQRETRGGSINKIHVPRTFV